MGRRSPTKTWVTVSVDPELYDWFYALKEEYNRLERVKHNNREFLRFLLSAAEGELARRRFRLRSY